MGIKINEDKKEVIITYETLFELLRREKDRNELQKLEVSFFDDVAGYLREKGKILENKEDSSSFGDKKKVETQIKNIKNILKELYERREKKIINLAVDKSRINSNIDESNLLKEEKELFDSLVNELNNSRKNILFNVISSEATKTEGKSVKGPKKIIKEKAKKDIKLVRFLYAVPKFVGKELEEYGPFEEEDIASLPDEIADVLINKGRAEEITEH